MAVGACVLWGFLLLPGLSNLLAGALGGAIASLLNRTVEIYITGTAPERPSLGALALTGHPWQV
jgi:hypothetical protein